ncbi:MAG: universal stress protein [Proteobacteria bacterium]|nr:universal stress protein [Pseudomonadota bacterium]
MVEFRKILFPVDLSEVSPRLVPYVKRMAGLLEAEVHVVFVARRMSHYASLYVPDPSIMDFESEIFKGAEKSLAEFMDKHLAEVRSRSLVLSGEPAEAILKYVEEESIDLIVMGTHGRKGLERIIFGSVAEHVVKKSPVPVMTINPFRGTRP